MARAKVTADDWRPPADPAADPKLGAALWHFWEAVREQAEHEQKLQRRFARALQLTGAVIHRPRSWKAWSADRPAPQPLIETAAVAVASIASRTRPASL